MFDIYLDRWHLVPDGDPTHSSHLLPVRHRGAPAMLKLALEEEERFGGALMEWWDGIGAARVLARDPDALLMERALSGVCLAEMARDGRSRALRHGRACPGHPRLHARHGRGSPGQARG
jgi:streptomycin 6-kinase